MIRYIFSAYFILFMFACKESNQKQVVRNVDKEICNCFSSKYVEKSFPDSLVNQCLAEFNLDKTNGDPSLHLAKMNDMIITLIDSCPVYSEAIAFQRNEILINKDTFLIDKRISAIDQQLGINKTDSLIFLHGSLMIKKEKFDLALKDFESMQSNYKKSEKLFLIGFCKEKQQRFDEALATYEEYYKTKTKSEPRILISMIKREMLK